MSGRVVFDFDKTLTYKDTLLGFFAACGEGRRFFHLRLTLYLGLSVLSKAGIISNRGLKHLGVRLFLSGLTRSEVSKAGQGYAASIRLNSVYFNEFKNRFPDAYIVSGSFPEYLLHLFRDDRLITSRIQYEDDKPVGLNRNCYRMEKLEMLRENGVTEIDSFYTDSKSDLPLARMAGKIYLVKGDQVIPCDSVSDFCRKAGNFP